MKTWNLSRSVRLLDRPKVLAQASLSQPAVRQRAQTYRTDCLSNQHFVQLGEVSDK